MKNRTIMLGLVLALVTASGAFAEPARALQGAVDEVAAPEQAITRFATGKTTQKEVEQALGEPNTDRIDAGQMTACYRYAGEPTLPESFIRIVGTRSGEADLTCCFRFTDSGVLERVAARVNQINSALVSAAQEDAKAGMKVTCPPLMLKPGTVVHLPIHKNSE